MATTGIIYDELKDVPAGVLDTWQPVVTQHLIAARGARKISLGEWEEGNTLAPFVKADSMIEIEGTIVYFDIDEQIDPATGVTGTNYLIIDMEKMSFEMTQNEPVWDGSKWGFYDGPHRKYTGHKVHFDGGSTYSKKRYFFRDASSLIVNADGKITGESLTYVSPNEYGEWTITDSPFIIPAGVWMMAMKSRAGDGRGIPMLYIKDDSDNWHGVSTMSQAVGGGLVSDGESFRLQTDRSNGVVVYRKVVTI